MHFYLPIREELKMTFDRGNTKSCEFKQIYVRMF